MALMAELRSLPVWSQTQHDAIRSVSVELNGAPTRRSDHGLSPKRFQESAHSLSTVSQCDAVGCAFTQSRQPPQRLDPVAGLHTTSTRCLDRPHRIGKDGPQRIDPAIPGKPGRRGGVGVP